MKSADFLIFPSLAYEAFGLTIMEALAVGLPVIASNHGAAAELICDGVTGMLFDPGAPADLAAAVVRALDVPDGLRGMRGACRKAFLGCFTAEANYQMLLRVYEAASGVATRAGPNTVCSLGFPKGRSS